MLLLEIAPKSGRERRIGFNTHRNKHKMENCTSETFQSMNFKSSHSPRRQNICISQQAPPCNSAAPAKAINVVLRIIYGLPRKFACFENSSFCTFPARERSVSAVRVREGGGRRVESQTQSSVLNSHSAQHEHELACT